MACSLNDKNYSNKKWTFSPTQLVKILPIFYQNIDNI